MLCKHHSLKRICKNSKSKKAYCSLFSYISVILNKYLIKTGGKLGLDINLIFLSKSSKSF